ncbi:hypothetical protein NC651_005176 [Populus alba x Populus x berolinensis]|nr:hypothetical protein NC651_005176 [Populus alba x Populus x berolinensis]
MEIGVRYDSWKHMEVDFASTKEKRREIVFAVKSSGFVPLLCWRDGCFGKRET